MSDKKDWFRTATNNAAPPPDGAPELMSRSGVNDSIREIMASSKRDYDDPGFRRPFEDYALAWISGTQFTLTDGLIESDATQHLAVGQRVRMIGVGVDAGNEWHGFISNNPAAPLYSSPLTAFHVEWILADSTDVAGPTTVPAFVEVSIKELGRAAFYDTGPTAGSIPIFEDLDPHVIIPEDELNVGLLDGANREELMIVGSRRRLNVNGGPSVWQRGNVFDSTTPYTNAADEVCADNWTIISDGDDRVDVSRSTDTPPGIPLRHSMLLTAATVPANQKHGVITFVEMDDGLDIADTGSTSRCSMSFWAKRGLTTGIDAIRAYVLNIKNREPTTTPVLNFASGAVGNVAFNAADWDLPIGGTTDPYLQAVISGAWQRFVIEDIEMDIASVGSGGVAIAFIVDDESITSGAQWHLCGVQLNVGDRALPYIVEPTAVELQRCLRHYESTFDESLERPANAAGEEHALFVTAGPTGLAIADWRFAVPKFKAPTLETFNPRLASPPTGDWDDTLADFAVAGILLNTKRARIALVGGTPNTYHAVGAAVHANVWGSN